MTKVNSGQPCPPLHYYYVILTAILTVLCILIAIDLKDPVKIMLTKTC
jgi:hypothetical protein